MEIERIEFLSSDGKTKVVGKMFIPEGDPIGMVQLVHGMCEYIDKYDEFATFLCENGFLVSGHNHLGHGETGDLAGKLGYFGGFDKEKTLIDDMYKVTEITREKFAKVPYFIFSHSMGSFVARNYLFYYGQDIDGIIICGTTGVTKELIKAKKLSRFIGAFKGDDYVSKLIYNMSNGKIRKSTKKQKLKETAKLNDKDRAIAEAEFKRSKAFKDEKDYRYCNYLFTVSAYQTLFSIMHRANTDEWFNCMSSKHKNLPIFFIAGAEDPVSNNGEDVGKIGKRLVGSGVENIEMKLYEGCRHEVVNSKSRPIAQVDILDWMKRHM